MITITMMMMIFTLLDRKPLIDSSAGSGLRLSTVTGEAEFREVTFKYPNRKTFVVLDNLDLSIRQVTMMRMITIMMMMIIMIFSKIFFIFQPSVMRNILGIYSDTNVHLHKQFIFAFVP